MILPEPSDLTKQTNNSGFHWTLKIHGSEFSELTMPNFFYGIIIIEHLFHIVQRIPCLGSLKVTFPFMIMRNEYMYLVVLHRI